MLQTKQFLKTTTTATAAAAAATTTTTTTTTITAVAVATTATIAATTITTTTTHKNVPLGNVHSNFHQGISKEVKVRAAVGMFDSNLLFVIVTCSPFQLSSA